MGPTISQSYTQWRDSLSPDDVESLLRAHYENELQHLLDMEADAQIQEEIDGRA